ncbi:2-amino-4-hydroxy-6- hydroxymethyldihydropteridine pyrophosphokinase [Acinetobacter sp. neg1]|uniref:2-amino-4-hydroxy-6- hydroxymethyldihydropteridine diphosphokinase n=1 Tax=Acinetobacter TaxID=469 RepID=UPI0005428024|nr:MULTISPECIES: 2-amino-4-hydroxy-6-hydroxymethyldihydropteridine diphosphokinase [Acinetobacter]KHF78129.1 2-amino-4-hydroxy-6- hydroxymethyldihydropteridine pyrophosphokinase [Acinetobacter sp. neg1]MBJ8482238.1 2-amino-4-hydroxy-6-hydroxymethyldihydropteridine diphosphokinase [Acinetobacter vivianii]
MNATETIFALALASNLQQQQNFTFAYDQIAQLGRVVFSPIYEIPCRDGIGANYWNSACLLTSQLSIDEITELLKRLEQQSGRTRPSHQITLDIDVIAWGHTLENMQFNPKKLPLALDVKIPLFDLWQHADLSYDQKVNYPVITM